MAEYRKALKNYTTGARIDVMVSDIQKILIDFGAQGIGFGYNDGRISSINFQILIEGNSRLVCVPLLVKNVEEVLRQQGVITRRMDTKTSQDRAYRVAIANVRDWLDSQLAYLATKQVEFAQLFLPYMADASGRTFYELIKEQQFTLSN